MVEDPHLENRGLFPAYQETAHGLFHTLDRFEETLAVNDTDEHSLMDWPRVHDGCLLS
jgi:hypothetical protein